MKYVENENEIDLVQVVVKKPRTDGTGLIWWLIEGEDLLILDRNRLRSPVLYYVHMQDTVREVLKLSHLSFWGEAEWHELYCEWEDEVPSESVLKELRSSFPDNEFKVVPYQDSEEGHWEIQILIRGEEQDGLGAVKSL